MILKRKEEQSCCSGSNASSSGCCGPQTHAAAASQASSSSCCGMETNANEPASGAPAATASARTPAQPKPTRQLRIDFLFLDLEVCTRCQGTDSTLDEAIAEVSGVLQAAGVEVLLNKVNVNTEELATRYRFVSSPTIRIDGRDIALDVKENLCESCGDLCGDAVDCRIWTWQGEEYTTPPKPMIVNAILQAVYGAPQPEQTESGDPFQLPENLRKFYEAMRQKDSGFQPAPHT